MSSEFRAQVIERAANAMNLESQAIADAVARLGDEFAKAIKILSECQGKIVVTGMGKSGHIARKISATLASTGSPAFFLHPSEALHGDLGMITKNDVLLAFAYGGETAEVLDVARFARRISCPVVSVTGKLDSSLAKLSDAILDGSVRKEVCPLNLAPTASTAVAMALGDAVAVCLMHHRGFSEVDFAALHPGGSLGRKLLVVSDVMKKFSDFNSTVAEDADFHAILESITKFNFGIVCVCSSKGEILGSISDGDIRRALKAEGEKALSKRARDIMKSGPKTVNSSMLAIDAFKIMEANQITSLFVVNLETPKKPIGIVRMHDLLASKIV